MKLVFSRNGTKKTEIDTINKPLRNQTLGMHVTNVTVAQEPDKREILPTTLIEYGMFRRISSGTTCSVCDK